MNADGLASSLVMRERCCGPGMRTHSSSKRTPRASPSSVLVTVMDKGLDIAIENCRWAGATVVNIMAWRDFSLACDRVLL